MNVCYSAEFTLRKHSSHPCNDISLSSHFRQWRCSHSTIIDGQADVFLQHCVEPSLIAEQDQSWLKAPVRLQVLGVPSSHQQGLRASWVSLSPSQLSGCLLSYSKAWHNLDSKLSHSRDVVSTFLCFLYIVNIHKQPHMNINIHEQLFHLGDTVTNTLVSQEFFSRLNDDCLLSEERCVCACGVSGLSVYRQATVVKLRTPCFYTYHLVSDYILHLPKWINSNISIQNRSL